MTPKWCIYDVSAHFSVPNDLMYLQPGVGASIEPGFWSFKIDHSILRKLGNILDDAFALYLCQHVMAGYEFLVEFYNPGDEVYFFGLSALQNPDGGPHLTNWVSLQGSRRRIHRSSRCSDATQGTILPFLSLIGLWY
jgi:hypothetical protein